MEEQKELLIMNFLSGSLSDEDQAKWDQAMEDGSINLEDIEGYKAIMLKMDDIKDEEPSTEMSNRFYKMLEKKIDINSSITFLDQLSSYFLIKGLSRGGLQAGYSVAILLIGLATGYLLIGRNDKTEILALSNEVMEMKSLIMRSYLEKDSPSERIKAVSLTREMTNVDDTIINALFSTLTNDNNTNVRLEALDALVRYSNRPEVRVGLIEALAMQSKPLVQLALAEIMLLLQDQKANKALEEMLKSKDVLEDVKHSIEEKINQSNS